MKAYQFGIDVGRQAQRGEERDSCGTGFVANTRGEKSHEILLDALFALKRLAHRGAVSPDGKTSDGAGMLTQIPYALFDDITKVDDDRLGVGMFFLPPHEPDSVRVRAIIEHELKSAGIRLDAWRVVPVDRSQLGVTQKSRCPQVEQVLLESPAGIDRDEYERLLYLVRRRIEKTVVAESIRSCSVPSMSCKTLVYKALVVPEALPRFYPDLHDPRYQTAIALFHQRYSTNTFPSWRLAQPLRMLAHNGEINTLLGNRNRMRVREPGLDSEVWGDGLRELSPVITRGSDSSALDNVLELLSHTGRNPVHAMAMLVPDAYEGKDLEPDVRAFYRYHAALMEPWDGPAALVFSNGRTVAAALDRNGLRPLRYWITDDDRMILASEAGVVRVPEERIVRKGRLGPGQMVSVNTRTGRVFDDAAIKTELAELGPWADWLARNEVPLPDVDPQPEGQCEDLIECQKMFGYGREHLEKVLVPMLYDAKEPIGSMGDDTPLAVLSEKPQRFFRFFKQRFAQVTNPPIDPYRERLVMSLTTRLGGGTKLLGDSPDNATFVELRSPVLTSREFAGVMQLSGKFQHATIDASFALDDGQDGLKHAVERLVEDAREAARAGATIIVLSDRKAGPTRAPVPILLACSAVHHGLIESQMRMNRALVCDTADVIEDHDFACLLGYGALLVHPYLALASVREIVGNDPRDTGITYDEAERNYITTLEKGILKIMAKLGISTVSSYRGAQTFEALGISQDVIDQYFEGTPSRIGGATLDDITGHVLAFHADAHGPNHRLHELGIYRFRRDGEYHAFNPGVFKALHKAVRNQSQEDFDEYALQVDDRPPTTLRDLLTWSKASRPIPLSEVEPAEDIVQRFCTQAMSFGSLSREAHETLAIAMNRLGGKSNSGEGGEEEVRFNPYEGEDTERHLGKAWHPHPGDLGNSAIKQVASGRFGVTPQYLVSAREIEIKMAQGSKPGEGGQIPGHKVTPDIASTRRSVPGVTLISPPPHHDIYSIEDLAQLIYDLKRVNQTATVCVKLVSGVGIGTIAAGVTKGYADTIQVSGSDGGTGASPLASIKHAGLPWELGLAEVQQTLAANGLRGRVKLRVDGGLKTGRDVVLAALLGGEEFGFGTAPLVAAGCVMARQCHANTCPVGVATQREDLRARYPGTPDHVVSFMYFVAEHVRMILAEMGVQSLQEIVGRTDLLSTRPGLPLRAASVDPSVLLRLPVEGPTRQTAKRNDRPEKPPLDQRIVDTFADVIASGEPRQAAFDIDNGERSVGVRLSGEIARVHGSKQLPDGTFTLNFTGQAGQSFGAFANHGMKMTLAGEAQDYVAKGLGGGEIAIFPPKTSTRTTSDVLAGNTLLYGATAGKLFIAGQAGERLAVRNSGATTVVEGCGDHGCEYMTGGVAIILGKTGYNFGAGMSGGIAYIWDRDGTFPNYLNDEMVNAHRASEHDGEAIQALLSEHVDATGSKRAASILEAFDPAEFWVVMPGFSTF